MKAIRYSLILFFFLLAVSPADGQTSGIMVTSYYDVNDYHFSSRINRFHRSYTEFTYYSPVFTDTYWYSYTPYSWGVSIYGGFATGYSYSYPVYNYGFYDGWYDPYFGYSYSYGYRPVYYNWYAPVVVVNRWDYHNHYYYGNNYTTRNTRNVYNVTNNYFNSTPVSNSRRTYSSYSSGTGRGSTPVRSVPAGSDMSDSRRISSGTGNEAGRNRSARPAEGNTRVSSNNPGNRDAVSSRSSAGSSKTPARQSTSVNRSSQPSSSGTRSSSSGNIGSSVKGSAPESSSPSRRSSNSSSSTSSESSRRK